MAIDEVPEAVAACLDQAPPERLDCDIVMAGGVTSGIVYPGAIAKIAERYSFVSIGGTSVGAAMAAATAAAEYGVRTGGNPRAFEELGGLPNTLGRRPGENDSRLLHLFTAEPATAPLFRLVTPIFSGGGYLNTITRLHNATVPVWQITLPVILAAVGCLALIAYAPERIFYAPALVLLSAVFVAAVWLATTSYMLFMRWVPAWKANGFGICTGNAVPKAKARGGEQAYESLTPWMNRIIQSAAGRPLDGEPLTFGHLWSAPLKSGAEAPKGQRSIELVMTTTDISRQRTAEIPFMESPTPLFVEEDILRAYFPESVADWMIAKAQPPLGDPEVERKPGVIRLPKAEDLPVLFGARMSLSFPVLLSAVPLMTPDWLGARNAKGLVEMRRVWFSDGGITSNFPIHFFDNPIPQHPTFCLSLVDFDTAMPGERVPPAKEQGGQEPAAVPTAPVQPVQAKRSAEDRDKRTNGAGHHDQSVAPPEDKTWKVISMQGRGKEIALPPFTAFDDAAASPAAFLWALINAARDWSDNQLQGAPGVRDRVVNIGLYDDEGGLNLNMPESTIANMAMRGRSAGDLISARFDPRREFDPETGKPNVNDFPRHRLTRFRSFMAAFEQLSRSFAASRRESDYKGAERGNEPTLDEMIDEVAGGRYGYRTPPDFVTFYHSFTDDLEDFCLKMADLSRGTPFGTFDQESQAGEDCAGEAPLPIMRFRLRPIVGNDPFERRRPLPQRTRPKTP